MFESLIGLVAIVAIVVVLVRQQKRIGLVERELGALRSLVLSGAARARGQPAEQRGSRRSSRRQFVAARPAPDIGHGDSTSDNGRGGTAGARSRHRRADVRAVDADAAAAGRG